MGKSAQAKAKRQKIQADLTLSKEFLPLLQDESGLEKVNILQFTKNRLDEIEKLHSSMKMSQLSSSKRVFQTLPKHLRRRAASHRPNRVPKSHRAASMAEHAALKQGNDRGKRPKNVIKRDLKALLKKRVVASDTLSPSTRRKGLWLETHLWHVKRFHMHDKWGYRLATTNNDKVYRKVIRDCQSKILMHDLSYELIYQVSASCTEPLESFMDNLLTDYSSILKEPLQRNVFRVHLDARLIGPVTVMYYYDCEHKVLFLCHPSIKAEFWGRLQELAGDALCLLDLSGKVCRFEFIGQAVLACISRVLRPRGLPDRLTDLAVSLRKDGLLSSARFALGGLVADPRLCFPRLRDLTPNICKVSKKAVMHLATIEPTEVISRLSSLYESTFPASSVQQINQRRHQLRKSLQLEELEFIENIDAELPFVVLKKPLFGALELQGAACYELWLPQGWAVHFWRSFIYSSLVFPIGLSDRLNLFEAFFTPSPGDASLAAFGFPYFSPGSMAYVKERTLEMESLAIKEAKRPLAKKLIASSNGQALLQKYFVAPFIDASCHLGRLEFVGKGSISTHALVYKTRSSLQLDEIRALVTLYEKKDTVYPWDVQKWGYSLVDEEPVGHLVRNPWVQTKAQGFNLQRGKVSALWSAYDSSALRTWLGSSYLHFVFEVGKALIIEDGETYFETQRLAGVRDFFIKLGKEENRQGAAVLLWVQNLNAPCIFYPVLASL